MTLLLVMECTLGSPQSTHSPILLSLSGWLTMYSLIMVSCCVSYLLYSLVYGVYVYMVSRYWGCDVCASSR